MHTTATENPHPPGLRLPAKHDWPADAAGNRMTAKVPIVHPDQTIGEAQTLVFHFIKVFQSVDYLYVVDRHGKLYGVLSIKELFSTDKNTHVGNVCKRESLVTVKPSIHQEKAVYLAIKNNIKAVPVVGDDKEFLGAITNDTILTILYKEAHEDLLRLAGIHPHAAHSNTMDTPFFTAFRHRFPWLLIGLLGGLLTASIMGLFEETLQTNLVLASFVPLIVYMSSAVGTQMQTCFVRDIALDHTLSFRAYLSRQAMLTFALAVTFSLLMGGAVLILHGHARLGLVAGLSLGIAVASSVATGLLLPFLFSKVKLDPADASGPVATILQDMLSIVIFLGVASQLM